MRKAPIYKDLWHQTAEKELNELATLIGQLGDHELRPQLAEAYSRLRGATQAGERIKKGPNHVGYGVSAAEKNVACDLMIALVREIKKQKAW
jgi:hypothetical protein